MKSGFIPLGTLGEHLRVLVFVSSERTSQDALRWERGDKLPQFVSPKSTKVIGFTRLRNQYFTVCLFTSPLCDPDEFWCVLDPSFLTPRLSGVGEWLKNRFRLTTKGIDTLGKSLSRMVLNTPLLTYSRHSRKTFTISTIDNNKNHDNNL